jgi:hypothetical protein
MVPEKDVWWAPDGVPWHVVTEYQFDKLRQLLEDLKAVLHPMPGDVKVIPDGDYQANGVPWAAPWRPDLLGHVSLDPVNRNDPGPQVLSVVRAWENYSGPVPMSRPAPPSPSRLVVVP